MTRPSGSHLSPDDIDAWLVGALPPNAQSHLDYCQECLERAHAEREIVEQLSGLPLMSPSREFADSVMASVIVPDPFAIRSMAATRRRVFATPKSLALAASLVVLLLGSMAGSIVWTLTHQATVASIGTWLTAQGGQIAWLGLRGLASNFIEQPWYASLRSMAENPGHLALASGLASLCYLVGIVALRRLLALPTQQVAHANS
jgi:hypothetical protein